MVHNPTYTFTDYTAAVAEQVNANFTELDEFFLELLGGTMVGDLIFTDGAATPVETIRLSYDEYPLSDEQILHASDCQLIVWIKFLPTPSSTEQWNTIDGLIRFAERRVLIKRFTDVRNESLSTPYYGTERRTTKPLRIF